MQSSNNEEGCFSADLEEVMASVEKLKPTPENLQRYLSSACVNNRPQIADYLLNKAAKIDHLAAYGALFRGQSVALFEVLLNHGWDINGSVGSTQPPLVFVLKDEELVKWFLDHGANPLLASPGVGQPRSSLVSNPGYILRRAAYSASISTVDPFLEHGARLEKSFALNEAACKRNNAAMMERLIELGANVDEFEGGLYISFRGTPLHRAIRSRRVENIRFLLQKGADPYFTHSPWERTPLEEAEDSTGPEIPEILELLKNAACLRGESKKA